MHNSDSLLSWLRLTLIPGVGGETQRKLLRALGSPEAIFSSSWSNVREIIGDRATRLLLETNNNDLVKKSYEWAQCADQYIVTLADQEYPQTLLETPDPPTLLYVRGQIDLLNFPLFSIVGSRTPTFQGIQNAERFSAALTEAGFVIVSGLALGIDAAAHRGALSGGATVAFIGTGIDRVYPARNHDLAVEIGAKGAIVSEFPLGTPATASNFPRRNRLIAGIAQGVLIVEAAIKSGSLITARLAAEQGREVFSIPGSIHSPQSKGCHQLIKQGAKLVETAQDILEELSWQSPIMSGHKTAMTKPSQHHSNSLLSIIGFDPCSLDELANHSGLSAESLSPQLLRLELEGAIARLPGGRYQRLAI